MTENINMLYKMVIVTLKVVRVVRKTVDTTAIRRGRLLIEMYKNSATERNDPVHKKPINPTVKR